jgi:hypothetical protein
MRRGHRWAPKGVKVRSRFTHTSRRLTLITRSKAMRTPPGSLDGRQRPNRPAFAME